MIIKERDPREHVDADKFSLAGAEAEKQMAFYLRRAFSDDINVLVLHDLRLKDDTGDTAQIDHLVMHREGFIIIESKSVTSAVEINKHGEWTRLWNGVPQGMPSPIQQAKRQIDFLRRALNAHRETLLKKIMLGLVQPKFHICPFDVLVAISDRGTIKRGADVPEVTKADQVVEKTREIIAKRKWDASLTNVKSTASQYNFSDEEMLRMAKFLTDHHYSLVQEEGQRGRADVPSQSSSRPPPVPRPVPAREPVPVHVARPVSPPPIPRSLKAPTGLGICGKCGEQCEILWGKFSYYWKCHACNNNMAIKEYCRCCKGKLKLRKDKTRFFIGCEPCKTEELYCEFV